MHLLIEFAKNNPDTTLIILILPIILGVILGWQKKIVIYSDFDDLFFVFCMFLLPIGILYLITFLALYKETIIHLGIFIEFILLISTCVKAFKNNNILGAILSIYTKLPLGFLFVFHLISILDKNKNIDKNRGLFDAISLFMLTPLILKLVHNKTGVIK